MDTLRLLREAGARWAETAGRQQAAMRLSLVVGALMLVAKTWAYATTGSAAILSDAGESIVHVLAVAFAAYSLRLSLRPADRLHPYGHHKIAFFSAGVEGALIVIAAVGIIVAAVEKWRTGLELGNLGEGTLWIAGATIVNVALGLFLIRRGRRTGSLILVANGQHVLTDAWTSFGVIAGLVAAIVTGWLLLDPLIAIAVALNILWSGGRLVRRSVGGLMDESDPALERLIEETLARETAARGLAFHELRYRNAGPVLWVEFHLLFPGAVPLSDAHLQASEIEAALRRELPGALEVISHLEPMEDHDHTHAVTEAPHRGVS